MSMHAGQVTELLGYEDELVVNMVCGFLEVDAGPRLHPKTDIPGAPYVGFRCIWRYQHC